MTSFLRIWIWKINTLSTWGLGCAECTTRWYWFYGHYGNHYCKNINRTGYKIKCCEWWYLAITSATIWADINSYTSTFPIDQQHLPKSPSECRKVYQLPPPPSFFHPPFLLKHATPPTPPPTPLPLDTHHGKIPDSMVIHWNKGDEFFINLCINFQKHNTLVSFYTDNFWKIRPSWKKSSIDL